MDNIPVRDTAKLLITIVEHGTGDTISAFLNKKYHQASFLTKGVGTAGTELMSMLGLDSAYKDVIFTLASTDTLPAMLNELTGRKFIKSSGNGIAFTLRLSGIASLLHAALKSNGDEPVTNGGQDMGTNNDGFSLVLAVSEPGYTDDIMKVASEAGATGGTVLYARGIGHEGPGKFLGINIQSEKEIVCILSPSEDRIKIMKAINDAFGIRSEQEANALVLSLPVEDMVQVS